MISILCICLSCIILYLENLRERRSSRVRYERLKNNSCSGRVVFVSDLHGRSDVDKIIWKIKKLKPDAIFSGGDLMTNKDLDSLDNAKKFLTKLVKIAPVYAGNGNHEVRVTNYDKYIEFLKKKNIVHLENEKTTVDLKNGSVSLSAIDIPQKYYTFFPKTVISKEFITENIGGADKDKLNIMLLHNPSHSHSAVKWGADVILSGHMHGGIIGMPRKRGLISPQAKFFPRYAGGVYKIENSRIITSRGLGTHTINIRLFNSAEIVVLDLLKGD